MRFHFTPTSMLNETDSNSVDKEEEALERGLMGCGGQVRLCSLPWKNSLAAPQNANCHYQIIQNSTPRYILKGTEFWAGNMAQWVRYLPPSLTT